MSVIACGLALACVDIPTAGDELLSFQFDPLPSPSVIVGDTLRDSLGAVKPLSVTGFNYTRGRWVTLLLYRLPGG